MLAGGPPTISSAEETFDIDTVNHESSNGQNRRPSSSIISARKPRTFRAGVGLENIARRTLGITLLLITVILWTSSNFLTSYIFADDTYSKPYFVTYLNTSFFAISLVPIFLRIGHQHGYRRIRRAANHYFLGRLKHYHEVPTASNNDEDDEQISRILSNSPLLNGDSSGIASAPASIHIIDDLEQETGFLGFRATTILSLEFCLLWFLANYFVAACLEYTSVASSTILTSTSSIWTLIFGALFRVERFTFNKLIGVLASLAGIILISLVDLTGDSDKNRGSFPHKSQQQIAIGDILAFISAILYGAYSVVMKKRIGNEDRVNMPLFFGLVGLFNVIFLWPGFFILHITGVETFEVPPTGKIWTIILLNSASSFVSDYCWAYAMLLTTPLVVTVGLSLTIPLSLIGQMILSSQYSSALYWVGGLLVVSAFIWVNHESHDEGQSSSHVEELLPGHIPA